MPASARDRGHRLAAYRRCSADRDGWTADDMKPDSEAILTAVVDGLPPLARWSLKGACVEYVFSASREDVRQLSPERLLPATLQPEWLELLIFGECDYAAGGGASPFLGVRTTDGTVWELDVERETDPLSLLNSSIDRFVASFAFLNEYLGSGRELPENAEAQLESIDPEAFPGSEWKALVEYLSVQE